MAKDKIKAKHPLVPAPLWYGGGKFPQDEELQLRDPINQIADFLEDTGFSKTLSALIEEAGDKHVQVDLRTWREFADDDQDAWRHTLMQMWKRMACEGRLKTFNGHEERMKADAEEEEELGGLSEDSEQADGGALLDVEAEVTDNDSSDDSDSSSDSGSVKVGQKRKRVLTPSSSGSDSSDSDSDSDSTSSDNKMKVGSSSSDSSSDSDSDSESSEDEDRPLIKRAKLSHTEDQPAKKAISSDSDDDKPLVRKLKPAKVDLKKPELSSDSDSDSSSDSSSDSDGSLKSKSSSSSSSDSKSGSGSSSSSSSGSSSDSESDSSSGSSSSSSSDDSSSDSSSTPSSPSPKKSKRPKKLKVKPKATSNSSGSTSSATLVGDAQVDQTESTKDEHRTRKQRDDIPPPLPSKEKHEKTKITKEMDTLLVPDDSAQVGTKVIPATKENIKQLKKEQIPFSRIPTDTKIDPKFGSNKYVSYDYADRAYQDLSVTKGKGFTKEKNKKKRGTSNTAPKPSKPASKRRLEREYAGLLDSDYEPDFSAGDGFDDYNPLGFKDDTFDFMSGCGFNPMSGSFGGF